MLVLLDRDGVINVDTPTGVLTLEEFHFLPRALAAITMLTEAGFEIAICTNQSAIGKGWMQEADLTQIHTMMLESITRAGGCIHKIYFAPEHPDVPSLRRKPAPGMLQEALQHFSANAENTPMVGDALRDLEAAAALGCPRFLTRTGKGAALEAEGIPAHIAPVTICDDLYAAAERICARYGHA